MSNIISNLKIILTKSFTEGIVAWAAWIIPALCTILSLKWNELPIIKPIYEFLGFYGIIELYLIILLLRIIFITFKMYESILATSKMNTDPIELTKYLHNCLYEINKAKEKNNHEDRCMHLQMFCNKSKKLFDKISNSHCCVSIKVALKEQRTETVRDLANLPVRNLMHDDTHKDRHSDEYNKVEHIVSENTAFISSINRLNDKMPAFIGKNLRSDDNYQTSSAKCSQEDGLAYNKELPYDSELVYPIFEWSTNGSKKEIEFRGFLCIDCEAAVGFDKSGIEVNYAKILSDGLFALIPEFKGEKS